MATKWQKIDIDIPEDLGPLERQALAAEVLDFIRTRTQDKNLDKNNKPFAKYSASYAKSLEFKIAGKSKSDVNLTLSGDMLGAMDLLDHAPGRITIGFDEDTPENARADGNIRGTYGHQKSIGPKRDFLGIAAGDLASIVDKYQGPLSKQRAEDVLAGLFASSSDDEESDDGE